jgi:tetratricopeptide (TPR) repeat protein
MTAVRLSALAFLLALAPLSFAAEPWDGAPLSADPKTLLAAAEAIPAGEAGVVVLLDETTHTFDEHGGSVSTQHVVYRIANDSAIDGWGQINAPWAPWYQERPQIQARVVSKDGSAHDLDNSALIEAAAPEESLDIFSDNRIVRAPLPGVAVGSVIEELITYKSKESLYDAASSDVFFFGGYQPVHRARLVIDAPASLALQFVNQSSIQPVKEEKDGRQHIVFEGGPFPRKDDFEWDLPYDVSQLPWIGVSTAKSWQELGKRYSEIIDKQIAGVSLAKELREALGGAAGSQPAGNRQAKGPALHDTVAKVLAFVEKHVRYAGVEVGESSVVPRAPQLVLANRYGDCKDKATLLVALLREAGIKAHVALLRAGESFDVPRDLPGLGMFNHAIVVVDGETPLWVDPTDEYSRAGELPLMDQGRLALIATADGNALATTPVFESAVNRVIETRTFTIPEEGKATVVETTESTGAEESAMRRFYASSDRKKYREQMEEYAKDYYSAKAMAKLDVSDPHDLVVPFNIRIEASEAERGMAMDGEAAVAIFPGGFVQSLPWSLRDFPDEKDDAAKEKKKRKNDFVFSRPFVREWRYRVVPPSGFVARTLPATETTKLGTLTLTKEFAVEPNGTVAATFRFDTGKRRLTAAEVEETKKALRELAESKSVMIGFDQRGQLDLTNGNISAALAEFRKLAAAHPKEGRHQVEIAKALLAGGMGDAAREQIRKAIALEPSYARAHRMLGIILQHDLFGRPFRKGFDLKAAIAAYRKAKELDPKDISIRAELAKLLEYGDEGLLYGHNANLAEAIAEFRSLITDLHEEQFQPELYQALAHAKHFDELLDAVKTATNPVHQNLWRVVVAGAKDGAKAAIREAGTQDQSQRKEILRNAAGVLLTLRMYPVAADLIEEATQGTPSSEARQQVESLRKARLYEEVPLPKDDPKSVVKRLVIDGMLSEMPPEHVAEFYVSDEKAYFAGESQRAEWHTTRVALLNAARDQGLPMEFYADLGLGATQLVQDGDEATGYRIRMRSTNSGNGGRDETLFVVHEGDGYRIAASRKAPALIGLSVLRLLDAGKADAARQWLNWAREEFPAGGGDDPLESTPFSKYWPKAKQSATADEIRLAAAMLMPSKELADRALPILTAAREKAASDDEKLRIDHATAITNVMREDFTAALPIEQRLLAAAPDSAMAFNLLVSTLATLDRPADIAKLANDRLTRFPKDDDALRALGGAAMNKGDYAACDKYYRQVIEELRPSAADYNNIAWNALLSGANLDRALEEARQAMRLPGANPALLHTIASLYAETGKSLEAREALLASMDEAGRDEPADHDWYVLGRIAENYGATDAALAAYKRVEKPKSDLASSTYVLAERRVKGLAKP